MCKIKELTNNLLGCYKDINKEYDNLGNQLRLVDLEVMDILHDIELCDFNACEGYWMAAKLKDARLRRREITDNMKKMNVLKNTICNLKNPVNDLTSTLGKINNVEQQFNNRIYKPRVRTDLLLINNNQREVVN